MKTTLTSIFTSVLFAVSCHAQIESPNFIFIIVDDLNDFVGSYTNDMPQVRTPAIDSLAASGTMFYNAFSSGTGCAPSRTALLSGKDIHYTQVYNNDEYIHEFRENFNTTEGNETVYTLPEILKANGYFTYTINKIYDQPSNGDFDDSATPECEKDLSWNRKFNIASDVGELNEFMFAENILFGVIPDEDEPLLNDFIAADSAMHFIQSAANGTDPHCGNPFFLAVGIHYPHVPLYVTDSFMYDDYLKDFYAEPFNFPYNNPANTFPYNGIVMPAQPDSIFSDYYNLPTGGLGQIYADHGNYYDVSMAYPDSMDFLPEIDPLFSDSDRVFAIQESLRADYLIAYLSAIEYADHQIGKIINELYSNPDLAENTIIVLLSDNGYSLGEKRHWEKWGLWETDIRIPMIISIPGYPAGVVQQPVSQIDLYPTICELAEIELPEFEDGTIYPDGKSLVPLINNPDLHFSQPAISAVRQSANEGSCYPSYSVRDERFQYIIYRKNNDGDFPLNFCDDASSTFEEELYEIGINRETDPHEWNNLINDENYKPVVEYLQQWLPDSSNYLQAQAKAVIQTSMLNCLSDANDTIDLSFNWYSAEGISETPPASYTYEWTNNLTGEILYGEEVLFFLSSIEDATFDSNNKIIFYLHVFNDSGKIAAFDIKYVFLNSMDGPVADFNLNIVDDLTAFVTDFTISGQYNYYWWDFGTGPMFTDEIPNSYSFDSPGLHIVTLYVSYGNDCIYSISRSFVSVQIESAYEAKAFVSPVPADKFFLLQLPDDQTVYEVDLLDMTGNVIYHYNFAAQQFATIETSLLSAGYYVVHIQSSEFVQSIPVIIIHQ